MKNFNIKSNNLIFFNTTFFKKYYTFLSFKFQSVLIFSKMYSFYRIREFLPILVAIFKANLFFWFISPDTFFYNYLFYYTYYYSNYLSTYRTFIVDYFEILDKNYTYPNLLFFMPNSKIFNYSGVLKRNNVIVSGFLDVFSKIPFFYSQLSNNFEKLTFLFLKFFRYSNITTNFYNTFFYNRIYNSWKHYLFFRKDKFRDIYWQTSYFYYYYIHDAPWAFAEERRQKQMKALSEARLEFLRPLKYQFFRLFCWFYRSLNDRLKLKKSFFRAYFLIMSKNNFFLVHGLVKKRFNFEFYFNRLLKIFFWKKKFFSFPFFRKKIDYRFKYYSKFKQFFLSTRQHFLNLFNVSIKLRGRLSNFFGWTNISKSLIKTFLNNVKSQKYEKKYKLQERFLKKTYKTNIFKVS